MTATAAPVARLLVWLALLANASCVLGPEPKPFIGSRPDSFVVWPAQGPDDELPEGVRVQMATLLERPLRERGYRVKRVLGVVDRWPLWSEEDPVAVAREEEVDAVLVIELRSWQALGGERLERLDYDVEYRVVNATTGRVAWRESATGSYEVDSALTSGIDWSEEFREPGPAVVPDVGAGRRVFRSAEEATVALHRAVVSRMPKAR